MKIRYGEKEDFEKAKNIWTECFTDSEEEVKFYFSNLYKKENYLVLEDKKDIKASLYENKYRLNIGGTQFPSFYIVGVAVSPEFRGRGYMKELLSYSLNNAKEIGYPFVYLSPINSSIYRNMGFEYISDIEKYNFSMNELINKKIDRDYYIKKVELDLIDRYIYDLMDIYTNAMKTFYLYVERDRETFRNFLSEVFSDGGDLYIFYRNGDPEGYIVFYKEEKIHVREIFGKNKHVIDTMFGFLKTFKEYYKDIEIRTPVRQELNFYFANQKKIERKIEPFIMGRIIDPVPFLEKIAEKNLNIKIRIDDSVVTSNSGFYTLTEGKVIFSETGSWDIRVDIGDLVQLLFGYSTFEELVFRDKIQINDDEIFKKLKKNDVFRIQKNYIGDYQ